MKFRNKILLSIWGVVLGVQLITFAIIQYWVREQVRARFTDELFTNYSTVRVITSLRSKQDVRSCQVIAESPRLKAVAELKDRETALQLSREINQELLSDLFVLTDSSGNGLVELVGGEQRSFSRVHVPSVDSALRREPKADVWYVDGGAFRVATVPVTVGSDLVGTLTIGFRLREDDIGLVKSVTGSEVVLLYDDLPLLSTFEGGGDEPGAVSRAWQKISREQTDSLTNPLVSTIETASHTYVATHFPLGVGKMTMESSVGFLLLKPVEQEVQAALSPVLRAFAVISLVVLVIAAVVGYIVSKGITRPIAALVRGTTEISRGNYDHQIDVKTGGELRFLAEKFEEMSASLKEKLTQLNERNRELEEALRTLKETQGRLQAVLDTSPALIFVKDLHGRYLLVNRRFETVFGVSSARVTGKSDQELFPPEIAKSLATNDRNVIQEGKSVEWEQIVPHTKRPQTYISNKFALHDATGAMYAVCGVLTDITQLKMLEEQLRQAQKLESLGTLAGGIAHDFNNILAIVLGHASILESRSGEPGRLHESVESIGTAVQRGTNLVRQLLTFARKTDVRFEPVNINSLIDEHVRMLQATFPKSIEFILQLDPTLPYITADANQVHQALLNLSVNARDAMQAGGKLSLKTEVVAGSMLHEHFPNALDEHYVRVSVGDTGPGMDEHTKRRIFEPFFTTKGVGRGTGLGLAVVYGVVDGHHGFVTFDSEIGQGTTFHLCFPVPKGEIIAKGAGVGMEQEIKGGTETILVVEDEEMLTTLLENLLTSKGYEVLTAGDGAKALDLYRKERGRIDLVLTDLGLPKLGGWELVKEIRKVNPETKVIVASGYFDPDVRLEMVKSGAKDFVQKPYLLHEVLKRVRDVIDGSV